MAHNHDGDHYSVVVQHCEHAREGKDNVSALSLICYKLAES